MQTQVVEFAVVHNFEKGTIEQIGKTSIRQLKPNFKGGSVKWYEDKLKTDTDKQETTELQNRDAQK